MIEGSAVLGSARARHATRSAWRVVMSVLVPGLLWSVTAQAQQTTVLDRFDIGIGGYYATSDTTLSARAPEGVAAASVNLEDDLGLGNRGYSTRLRADVLIGRHQGLSVDYYRYSRDGTRYWDHAVPLQGVVHDVHARLEGRLSFAFGSVAWRWWFGDEANAIGLGLGASHYRASAAAIGHLQVDSQTLDLDQRTGTSVWAPLLRVGWRHAFGAHWRLYFDAAGVFKNGGKLKGHIYNASLGAQWLPMPHLGLALEYGINSIHLKQRHRYYHDSLDLELNGPSAFVYLRF